MNNKSKNIIFKISNSIVFIPTIFQVIIFIIKGAFPLAGISLGLIIILIVHMFYENNKIIKIITLFLLGLYLLENIIMTYVYMPSPQLPILLFVAEIIMDIAIVQNIILSICIKQKVNPR